ncbi:replicative DNA helicase, partial [Ruminococcaceae bacterium OttesenSCG-928-O06]|nr:replicative DNA helicase [Ruminococcaceae bacterium OttesenSCG-928-O06]
MANDMGLSLEGLGITAPYSMQAEQSVLGAALLDPSCIEVIIQRLRPEMFFVRQNRAVCTEMFTLVTNATPVDVVVLVDRLAGDVFPTAADAKSYLAELADTVPSLSNLTHYIGIVYEKYVKRQLMELARETLEQAADDIESRLMMESAEQRLYEIRAGRDSGEVQHVKYAVIDVMNYLHRLSGPEREEYLGIKTGFSMLDRRLGGMGKSDLII